MLARSQLPAMSSDPLGFFAGEASSSSEDEDDDGGTQQLEGPTKTSEDAENGKLPSPDTLFATVGRPAFLDNPLEGHINWDRFVKTQETSPEPNVHSSEGYVAIPPPDSLASDTQSISAAPVRYTTPSGDTDPKLLTVSSSASSNDTQTKTGTKRSHEETEDESSKKKKGGETFRQKEKRKRDLGQTSRGKSYVEEEKRILRQAYGMEEDR